MTDSETTAHACTTFTIALLRRHHSQTRRAGEPVDRCACGAPAVLCEVNTAGRTAGLLHPVTTPNSAQPTDVGTVTTGLLPAPEAP